MPDPDFAAIIKSLPHLVFTSPTEAPDASCYLIGPSPERDYWVIGYQTTGQGWATADGDLIDDPPFVAALPPTPFELANMARKIAALLADRRFNEAARMTDQLADEIRRLRDSPLTGSTGGAR